MTDAEKETVLEMFSDMRTAKVRQFGVATRNPLGDKIQYFGPDGLFSVPAIRAYGKFMRKHRTLADGALRDYNNWRQGDGIPQRVCIDSLSRHMLDLAELLEDVTVIDEESGEEVTVTEACCAIIFNAMAILDAEVKGNI